MNEDYLKEVENAVLNIFRSKEDKVESDETKKVVQEIKRIMETERSMATREAVLSDTIRAILSGQFRALAAISQEEPQAIVACSVEMVNFLGSVVTGSTLERIKLDVEELSLVCIPDKNRKLYVNATKVIESHVEAMLSFRNSVKALVKDAQWHCDQMEAKDE